MSNDNIAYIIIFLVACFITLRKRSKQLGKMWNGELRVYIQDKELTCSHCNHNRFKKREGLLTTSWVTFFRFAFWNQSAPCYVCANCGNVHWFLSPQEKTEANSDL